MNASTIAFDNCEQIFLAAQAPKPVSFNHFWHMVIQEEVGLLLVYVCTFDFRCMYLYT